MYLYFLSQGLSFAQIAILESLYNLTTVFGEVPTGYVGDRIGRRNSLLVGTGLISGTLVAIGFAGSFAALAILYVCWSMGYNFRSGSEDAWLYDALTDERSGDEFARVRGRGESVALLVGVGASIIGGYLGGVDLSYPFFVAAGVTSLGLFVLLAVDESETYERTRADRLGFGETLGIVRKTASKREIRSFVLYYFVLFSAVSYLVFIFLQPVFEAVIPQYGVSERQIEPLLGWFYAAISLVAAGLSYNAGWIVERVGLRRWFVVIPLALGASLAAMYVVPLLAIPVLLFARSVGETTRTLAGQYVNDRIESLGRATVLSAMAMVSGLTVVPFQLGGGALSDAASPLLTLGVAGGVLFAGSLAILAWEMPVRTPASSDNAVE
nr:MFS transporter [Haloprofundus salinisoli]